MASLDMELDMPGDTECKQLSRVPRTHAFPMPMVPRPHLLFVRSSTVISRSQRKSRSGGKLLNGEPQLTSVASELTIRLKVACPPISADRDVDERRYEGS